MKKICFIITVLFCCAFAFAANWSFVEGSTTKITDGNFVLEISTNASSGETSIVKALSSVEPGVLDLRGVENLGLKVTTLEGHSLRDNKPLTLTGFIGNTDLSKIKSYTFCKQASLASAEFEGSISLLEENVFESCSALAYVKFANVDNLEAIGGSAFSKCTSLMQIVPTKFPNVKKIGGSAFLKVPLTDVSLEFPEMVDIGQHAFNGTRLYKLTANKLVKGSSDSWFLDSFVKNIEMKSLVDIPNNFCSKNSSLKTCVVSSAVTNIGNNAFGNCSSLVSLTPMRFTKVQNIGSMAFHKPIFSGVLDFSLSTFTKLPDHCLRSMPNLSEIRLPETLTEVYSYNFAEIKSSQKVIFLGDKPVLQSGPIFGENKGRAIVAIRPKYEKSWIDGGAVSPIANHEGMQNDSAYPGKRLTIGLLDTKNEPKFSYQHWVVRYFDPGTLLICR